ncbi:DUF4336 domain-containing protein [Pelagicoccus albus]|uniref:DUF4336 domain-containing protein n=1 Tax=Pelagicoccus albus TaxID=415222 RepID=A0A7X1B9E0_9BACT|nr:DUF4336 domain-containing protein [Pelagicoccus albus]MBC2607967.1 DUF4336 domain-containing protein [Pelagicoccus albus]
MKQIGTNIWIQKHKLSFLGLDVGRTVTAIRLASGEVLLHSTAPFKETHLLELREIGPVAWVVEPMNDHDTFTKEGLSFFPDATFLAPVNFPSLEGVPRPDPIFPAPEAWSDEIEVLRIEGAPWFNEYVFFHRPSRTLIVCDLLLNFPEVDSSWKKLLLTLGLGKRKSPGVSRRFKLAITDEEAFRSSILKLLQWDFQQVVVGHGEPILKNAKAEVTDAFEDAGWLESVCA